MQKFITFGETMVQYNAEYTGSFDPKKRYFPDVAGAESNVAINLSKLTENHAEIFWVSRLGRDDSGRLIQKILSQHINIDAPICFGEKTGISYLNHHANGQHVKTYFRKGSAASEIPFEQVKKHLKKADMLHITGITPALSNTNLETVVKSLEFCNEMDIPVCLDVNYREQLWNPTEAKNTLEKLLPFISIFKVGHDEAETIWHLNLSAEDYAANFYKKPGTLTIVTDGESGAVLFNGTNYIREPSIEIEVIDPVGAGDAFVAGFLGTLIRQNIPLRDFLKAEHEGQIESLTKALRVGNICGALTCTKKGDTAAMPTLAEIESFLTFP